MEITNSIISTIITKIINNKLFIDYSNNVNPIQMGYYLFSNCSCM